MANWLTKWRPWTRMRKTNRKKVGKRRNTYCARVSDAFGRSTFSSPITKPEEDATASWTRSGQTEVFALKYKIARRTKERERRRINRTTLLFDRSHWMKKKTTRAKPFWPVKSNALASQRKADGFWDTWMQARERIKQSFFSPYTGLGCKETRFRSCPTELASSLISHTESSSISMFVPADWKADGKWCGSLCSNKSTSFGHQRPVPLASIEVAQSGKCCRSFHSDQEKQRRKRDAKESEKDGGRVS